jgi:hypothetical protein
VRAVAHGGRGDVVAPDSELTPAGVAATMGRG